MINKQNQSEILTHILDLLESACEACLQLQQMTDFDAIENLAKDLKVVSGAVRGAKESFKEQLEHAYTDEILDNIEDTLDEICRCARISDRDRIAQKIELQLYPFCRQLAESFYFWDAVQHDEAWMQRYYAEEFALHNNNQYGFENDYPYKLSIIVPAYNHLDVTKRCVEQLLKETDLDALNAELILLDHGSTDGTLEYFESLGVGKVVHFMRNVRMYMFVTMAQICQGEYFAFVSNDVLVTKDWAKILLACFESDQKIIAAVPATPNIANLQMLHVPTNDPDEFVLWASKQNKSDPSRWNDRARVMPPIAMYRTALVSEIGFADPYFYSMEFWDDDFSLRARRAGYRQLVCDDVACYHFGSVTGAEAQKKEGTLVYGRQLFINKNKVDAWGSGFCYDYSAVQLLDQIVGDRDARILGVDCGLGDTMLQIRNVLRHRNRKCTLYNATSQKAYIPDLSAISDEFTYSDSIIDGLEHELSAHEIDVVYLGRNLEEYPDPIELLKGIYANLREGSSVFFACNNPYFVLNLNQLMNLRMPDDANRISFVDPFSIKRVTETIFSTVQMVNLTREIAGTDTFIKCHFGNTEDHQYVKNNLSIEKYYFWCKK